MSGGELQARWPRVEGRSCCQDPAHQLPSGARTPGPVTNTPRLHPRASGHQEAGVHEMDDLHHDSEDIEDHRVPIEQLPLHPVRGPEPLAPYEGRHLHAEGEQELGPAGVEVVPEPDRVPGQRPGQFHQLGRRWPRLDTKRLPREPLVLPDVVPHGPLAGLPGVRHEVGHDVQQAGLTPGEPEGVQVVLVQVSARLRDPGIEGTALHPDGEVHPHAAHGHQLHPGSRVQAQDGDVGLGWTPGVRPVDGLPGWEAASGRGDVLLPGGVHGLRLRPR